MVLKYDQGIQLSELLKKGSSFSEAQLVSILLSLLGYLKPIHNKGLIHRNINPSNIYIQQGGSPILIDPATVYQRSSQLFSEVIACDYAPFERRKVTANEKLQGPWTDIYSLAAIVYHAISGSTPKSAASRSSAISNNKKDPYKSLSLQPELSKKYSIVFLKAIDAALSFRVHERPQSAETWSRMLTAKVVRHELRKNIASKKDLAKVMPIAKKRETVSSVLENKQGAIKGGLGFYRVAVFLACVALVVIFFVGEATEMKNSVADVSGKPSLTEGQKVKVKLGAKANSPKTVPSKTDSNTIAKKAGKSESSLEALSPIEKLEAEIALIENDKLSQPMQILNRYRLHQEILNIDPSHLPSQKAIRKIQLTLADKVRIALVASGSEVARDRLILLEVIGAPESLISEIDREISAKELPAKMDSVEKPSLKGQKPAKVVTKKVEPKPVVKVKTKELPSLEAALDKIDKFNMALELGDLKAIEKIAQISDKNKAFLNLLFSEYGLTNTQFSKVNHISTLDIVEVDIEITKLINKAGYVVSPSRSWSTIPIKAQYDETSGWNIVW